MSLYFSADYRTGSTLDDCGGKTATMTGTLFQNDEKGLSIRGGASQYLTYSGAILPATSFSVIIWGRLKYSTLLSTDANYTIANVSGGTKGIALQSGGTPIINFGTNVTRTFNYTPDKKYHCWVFTYNSAITDSALYVDTINKAALVTVSSGTPDARSGYLYIGGSATTNGGAMIARIKVYDTVIDAAQILREQEEFEQARALTRMSRCSIPQANGSTITLLENWKYYGVGNSPTKKGEWIVDYIKAN
jgi:hypothetical protein